MTSRSITVDPVVEPVTQSLFRFVQQFGFQNIAFPCFLGYSLMKNEEMFLCLTTRVNLDDNITVKLHYIVS